jgi:hypothetical protein
MVLWLIVTAEEPLNDVPETAPEPPLLNVIEFVVVPPGGAAHVPSALKKLVVPPPEAGASPFNAEVKVS